MHRAKVKAIPQVGSSQYFIYSPGRCQIVLVLAIYIHIHIHLEIIFLTHIFPARTVGDLRSLQASTSSRPAELIK